MSPAAPPPTFESLIEDADALARSGQRRLLGITGAPGAGKSTLAAALVDALGGRAVLVSQDAFHLSNAELRRLGRLDRKGAVDTFDAAGFQHLLRRLRDQRDPIVYTAEFDRSIEESIACTIPIAQDVPLVVVEGNYLLVADGLWRGTDELLDLCWYIDIGEELRLERLIARHMRFGRSPTEARERSLNSDQTNAMVIASTRERADRVIPAVTIADHGREPGQGRNRLRVGPMDTRNSG